MPHIRCNRHKDLTLKITIGLVNHHPSSSMSVETYHGVIASAKTYCGNSNLNEAVQWQSLGRDGADVLVNSSGKPAVLTIIGAIINDKLIAGPLGNFQSREDNYSRSDNKMRCDQAKLVVVIGTPPQTEHPKWAQDFEMATKNLREIQENMAKSKPNAPRLHFLDLKTGNVRFTHALWEKKVRPYDAHMYIYLWFRAIVHTG